MSARPRPRIDDPAEAEWAGTAYARQLKAVNAGLAANEQPNHFSFLPCGVNVPVTAGRCSSPNDGNWPRTEPLRPGRAGRRRLPRPAHHQLRLADRQHYRRRERLAKASGSTVQVLAP